MSQYLCLVLNVNTVIKVKRNHSVNEIKNRHRPRQEAHRSDTPVIGA